MRLLDLFCGAGGCSVGYHRAGFTEIVGVDNRPMPRYPFHFVQMDAIEALERMNRRDWYIESSTEDRVWFGRDFDVIHASPPCQAYTRAKSFHGDKGYPRLVDEVRDLLIRSGKEWVIENVPGSPMQFPITLCGTMFGLNVYRHRLFECSRMILAPEHRGTSQANS